MVAVVMLGCMALSRPVDEFVDIQLVRLEKVSDVMVIRFLKLKRQKQKQKKEDNN